MLDQHHRDRARQRSGSARPAPTARPRRVRRPARRAAAARARTPARERAPRASGPRRGAFPAGGRLTSSQPSRVRVASARSRRLRSSRSERGRPSSALARRARRKRSAPTITFSSTVSRGNSPTPCSVRAIPSDASRSGRILASGCAAPAELPDSGVTKPQITLNSVVFPAPLGPITPSTSPRVTSTETPSSAVMPPKRTVTSRTDRPAPCGSSLDSTRGSYSRATRIEATASRPRAGATSS